MNIDNLNKWFMFVTNLGVLLGIVFLGIEIQQNSDLMKIQISQARADSIFAAQESLYNSEYAIPSLMKTFADQQLSIEDSARVESMMRAMHRIQENFLLQIRAGMLPEASLESIRNFLNEIARSQILRDIWNSTEHIYSEDYRNFVNEYFEQNPI